MKKIIIVSILLATLMLLVGCATPWQNTSTSGYLTATNLATIAEQTCQPTCASGAIPADKCAQLKKIYGDIDQGLIASGNTLILAISTADQVQQKTLLNNYNTLMTQIQANINDYTTLYNQLTASEKKGLPKFTISPAVLQMIINAFLAIVQDIPNLINAIGQWSVKTVDVPTLTAQIKAAQAALPVWK